MIHNLEYTPSVYFNFDDTANKTIFSNDGLFQLSCTHQKNHIPNNLELTVKMIPCDNQIIINNEKRLKTDQFFEEFDNNFIVTFDQESAPINNQYVNANSYIINESNTSTGNYNWANLADSQEGLKETAFFEIESHQLDTKHSCNQFQKEKVVQCSLIAIEVIPIKQKNSPIPAFEIKKRTVFKNKQNILNNQHFKITKKKILNKNTLQIFLDKSKSCVPSKKELSQKNDIQSLTSKIQTTSRVSVNNIFKNHFIVDNNYKSDNIFVQHKQFRQSFRSITLNNWKRKLHNKKISQDKTKKRENIFQYNGCKQHITLR